MTQPTPNPADARASARSDGSGHSVYARSSGPVGSESSLTPSGIVSGSQPHLDPDVLLMLRVRDDDGDAFKQIVERFQKRVIRLMISWVGSKEHAEDLAQEVFMRVFRSRKSYEPTAKFSTWLFRIANNLASNAVRDRSRRKEYQLAKGENSSTAAVLIENIALAPSGSMPVRKLDSSERANMVQHAVMALNERQRIALTLSKFEGLSYIEIAETMDLSVKAVKSLLSRARVNLRMLLQPYVEEGMSLSPDSLGAQAQGDVTLSGLSSDDEPGGSMEDAE